MKDARFENISGPAIIVSNEDSRLTQINLEDIYCREVPVFARFRESGRQLAAAGKIYHVKAMSHGLTLAGMGAIGLTTTAQGGFTIPERQALERIMPTFTMVVDNLRLYERTRLQAVTDGLTRAFKHRHFQELLHSEGKRAHRGKHPLSDDRERESKRKSPDDASHVSPVHHFVTTGVLRGDL